MKSKNKTNKHNKTNKRNKTKKNSILTRSEKTIEDIIKITKEKKYNTNENTKLIKYFKTPYTKAGLYLIKNDFFTFINEIWLNKLIMDKKQIKYLIKIDDFRILQFQIYDKLNEIINKYFTNNNDVISLELKNFYNSSIKFNTVNSSKLHLKNIIEHIDFLRKDKSNLWKMLAFINKNELTNQFGPFSWELSPDTKNTTEYINYIYPHTFAIFDISIYSDTNYNSKYIDLYNKKYKLFFNKYLKKLLDTTIPNDKSVSSEDVFEIGQLFFSFFGRSDPDIEERSDNYYKVYANEAYDKYGFNWHEYCKELGYNNNDIPEFFVTTNLNFLKFCIEVLNDQWNSEKWRSYWIWVILRYVTRFTHKWHEMFYKFYGQQLEGMEESFRSTPTHASVIATSLAFNPILNNEFIKYSYNEDNIVYTKKLANSLRDILINKIYRNNWLTHSTRSYAINKLRKIEINVGNDLFDYNTDNKLIPLLNYNPDEFLDNMIKVMNWRHNLYITKQIKVIESLVKVDWSQYPPKIINLPSYIVNAQYILNKNSINISNAYLQKPFINLDEHGIQYNLAYIGFTIAHELSHSLDDMGSQFDVNGNFNDWWSKKDRNKFKKIQDSIIYQYKVFSNYDKIQYDAALSIGEDIADINGLAMCEEYLRDFCIKNQYTPVITFAYFRMFYIYFAYQMRQKIKEQSIRYELISNPHPLDKLRTNVPLSRSQIFRTMFDINKGDHMYWDNKTGIWS